MMVNKTGTVTIKVKWNNTGTSTVSALARAMARKVVRVYLSIEQKKLLEKTCKTLGMDESEAFMDYAKSISLVTEKVHGKI